MSRRRYGLSKAESYIGRDPACDIPLADPTVSRRHAVVRREHDGSVIRDLDSASGIRVNGTQMQKYTISTLTAPLPTASPTSTPTPGA